MNTKLRSVLALSAAVLTSGVSLAADMHVSAQWPLKGPVGWDYLTLDAAGAHLFIAHATQVDVVDTQTGSLLGTVQGTNGVHGIALDEKSRRGYASNGRADSVTLFDLDSFKTLKEAPVSGHNPDAILFDAAGKHVFTFNGRSKDVSVLSAGDLMLVATLKVPDKPEFAVEDDDGHIFVNIESEAGQLAVIDAKKLELTSVWNLPGCASPSGLTIDKAHHRLFSVCDAKVMAVTDSTSGKQIAKVAIGEGPDAAAYDARRALVFSSNGEGTLSIVHQDSADQYRVLQTLPTKRGARTMALDAGTGDVFLVTADFQPAPAGTHTRPAAVADSFTILKVSR